MKEKKIISNIINDDNKEEFEIPNIPLCQQDGKLFFNSFIKIISKAVRNEKINKNAKYSINNNIKYKEKKN